MGSDVVELIEQDHREMERTIERLQGGEGSRALLVQQLGAILTAHSRAEEAEVYPEIANSAGADAVSHAREEHAEADELLAKLKGTDPNSSDFDEALEKLTDAITEHISEEESETLPALRAGVDSRRLEELGQAFVARRGSELEHGPTPHQVDERDATGRQGGGQQLQEERARQEARVQEETAQQAERQAESQQSGGRHTVGRQTGGRRGGDADREPAQSQTAERQRGGRQRGGRQAGGRQGGKSQAKGGHADVAEMTKTELYRIASEHEIPGRSQMSKDELQEAVQGVIRS